MRPACLAVPTMKETGYAGLVVDPRGKGVKVNGIRAD